VNSNSNRKEKALFLIGAVYCWMHWFKCGFCFWELSFILIFVHCSTAYLKERKP